MAVVATHIQPDEGQSEASSLDHGGWEVSIVCCTSARLSIRRGVATADLPKAIYEAQCRIAAGSYPHPYWKTGALLVQRMDRTAEALRAKWESDFYDVDRAGRRRRRFKRPAIEKDWEEMLKRDRAEARTKRQISNASKG